MHFLSSQRLTPLPEHDMPPQQQYFSAPARTAGSLNALDGNAAMPLHDNFVSIPEQLSGSSRSAPGSVCFPLAGRAPVAGGLGGPSTASRPSSIPADAPNGADRRKEAELEAERLWWSEASERQVKDLEGAFSVQFQKSTERLKAEIETCQDRLEILVESERQQRHSAIASVKREVDEFARVQPELRSLEHRLEAGLRSLSGVLADSPSRTNPASETSSPKHGMADASFAAEWEQHKIQMRAVHTSLVDLRRDVGLQKSQVDFGMQDLRRDLDSMRDFTQRPQHVAVHDIGATEEKLWQRIEGTRQDLEISNRKVCTELAQVLAQSCCQLAQNFDVIRAEFDALKLNFPGAFVAGTKSVGLTTNADMPLSAAEASRLQVGGLRPSHANQANQLPPSQHSQVSPNTLVASINGMVRTVQNVVSGSSQSGKGDEVTDVLPESTRGGTESLEATTEWGEMTMSPMIPAALPGHEASGVDTPAAQDGFLRALQAVNELRERNISLREENNEMMEELLLQDGAMTPACSVQGMQWTPSAQQSTCNSPGNAEPQTLQFLPNSLTATTATEGRPLMPSRPLQEASNLQVYRAPLQLLPAQEPATFPRLSIQQLSQHETPQGR